MADKQISQLVAATTINNDDLFVMQQGGTAKKLSGQKLSDFVYASAADQIERVNEAVEQTQEAVDTLEEQKNEIAETIASMAELGTDTTLTTPGMAADAAATGEVKDIGLARFEQAEITGVPIATFDDGADDVPVKKLVVNIDPVQDLHGYDYPWPAGGGKNLIYKIISGANINSSGTVTTDSTFSLAVAQVTNEEIYTFSNNGTALTPNVVGYYATDPVIGSTAYNATRTLDTPATFTATYTGYICLRFTTSIGNKLQLEAGSSATSFAPYSNICPITGWTGANVNRTGKNLFNKTLSFVSGYLISATGEIASNGSYQYTNYYTPVKPSTNYAFSGQIVGSGAYNSVAFYDASKGFISRFLPTQIGTPAVFITPSNCYYIRFNVSNAAEIDKDTIQLEEGSSATTYEPFGTTYPITFPTEAGTVYGGTLDVTNGVLTVDKFLNTVTALTSVVKNSEKALTDRYSITLATSIGNFKNDSTNISNIARYNWGVMGHTDTTAPYQFAVYNNMVFFTYPAGTETTDTKQWLIDNNVCFLVKLNTPITYTLTSTEVKTLLALNNIWADTGNINDLIYRKMPIPVEELENTLESMIAGVEETMEATQNYTVDKLVVAAHKLYHIDSNIASGETLVPGTNCHVTTVADELANFMSTVDGYFTALGSLATLNYQVVT